MQFGYALLWALAFATIGTIVLQEMSARLGVIGRLGLGEAIRLRFSTPGRSVARALSVLLIVSAIGIGNAAYQTGNLLGAGLGLQGAGGGEIRWWSFGVALLASAILWTGSYRFIERALVALVLVMSTAFLVTAFGLAHDLPAIARAISIPRVPQGGLLIALGLIGTTIVPYNLFLHAVASRERWQPHEFSEARWDLVVAIGLGGVVSMAIVVTAAATPGGEGTPGVAQMAAQLEPLLGSWARVVFATGFAAAGVTSAITAPMAAAYAMSGVFGWVADLRSPLLRVVWISVMVAGTSFAMAGMRPVPAILFAQAANGILLPVAAIFLLIVMNDRRMLRTGHNGWIANIIGGAVVLLTIVLGARAIWGALS